MNAAEESTYFFDTSALVKRYHKEAGTDVVDTVFDDQGAVRVISDLSVIELYSAFAKKVRIGEITKEDFHATIRALGSDIQGEVIRLVVFGDDDKREAAALIEQYGPSRSLRTLDAMQLAAINKFGSEMIACVYCADRQFAAIKEGYSVVDPEQVPES